MKQLVHVLLLLCVGLFASSCSKDEAPAAKDEKIDILFTFNSSGEPNGTSTFGVATTEADAKVRRGTELVSSNTIGKGWVGPRTALLQGRRKGEKLWVYLGLSEPGLSAGQKLYLRWPNNHELILTDQQAPSGFVIQEFTVGE